jgi:hypothetical protein
MRVPGSAASYLVIGSPLLTLCLALAGCVEYLPARASSLGKDSPATASVKIEHSRADVSPVLDVLFKERGFQLVNKIDASPAVSYYIFKGPRQSITDVRGNSDIVVAETYNIGSWFAARLAENRTGTITEVFLLGKPTVNGTEVCSDADALLKEVQYWCIDTKFKEGAPEVKLITGREEAETVKGILVELTERVH